VAETGSHSAFDAIVVVSAPEPVRIQRVMERDGVGEADVLARMRSQTSEEERIKIADHVVINDGTSLVIPQVLTIHEALK
jgi:dephospho-CoA kinase